MWWLCLQCKEDGCNKRQRRFCLASTPAMRWHDMTWNELPMCYDLIEGSIHLKLKLSHSPTPPLEYVTKMIRFLATHFSSSFGGGFTTSLQKSARSALVDSNLRWHHITCCHSDWTTCSITWMWMAVMRTTKALIIFIWIGGSSAYMYSVDFEVSWSASLVLKW